MKKADSGSGRLQPGSIRTDPGLTFLPMAAILAMLVATVPGQTLEETLPQKNLAFAQVATGPSIETVICTTNRGDSVYRGCLSFWKAAGQEWNPVVNGVRISGSALNIAVGPGETRVFRITGDSLQEAGAAMIVAADQSQTNFIEGSLTYSIEGRDYDSVGIAPSVGLFRSVIPFEDFAAVGLALANPNPSSPAEVTLRLMDDLGAERESSVRVLPRRSHEARFLHEIFSTEVQMGRVEIESTEPILGTAVTLIRGEFSALPMLPSPVTYTVIFRSLGRTDEAEALLWTEGAYAKGYLRFLKIDGIANTDPATYLLSGTLENGVLRLFLVGAGPDVGGREMINTLKVQGFRFATPSYSGAYTRVYPWLSFPFTHVLGTYELTRRD